MSVDLNKMLNEYVEANSEDKKVFIRQGKYIVEVDSFSTEKDKNNKPCFLVGMKICALGSKLSKHDVGDVVYWKRSINKYNIQYLHQIVKALHIDTDITDMNDIFDTDDNQGFATGKKLMIELVRPEGKQFDETTFSAYDLTSNSFEKNLSLATKLASIKKKQAESQLNPDDETVPF